MNNMLTWRDVLAEEKKKLYFTNILELIKNKRSAGIQIYPAQKDVFNAFRLTELKDIKVVILGQDPYCRPKQAHGLAFSVLPEARIPPSLKNIYKELFHDIYDFKQPKHGFLGSWAKQGILLLNTILTVEEGKSFSHAKIGWEKFTNTVINIINKNCNKVIFLLWGLHAQNKGNIVDLHRHYILQTSHPSPKSANLGFLGCKHFSQTNNILITDGKQPIQWTPKLSNIDFSIHHNRF
ncbi:uracil-DNA glycosylase [Candidatus Pantoea edessiphila]|uniref:Uracil-DNA glycosylase n=1 Tax=Candidatus Pantoea edessiphila TaxID=2044610 RepID=A0A2P5SYC3_9GAMM|nr:uracil-DNA glycosylase [Candidatus Pantoea edessiphila]MBK4775533.1 uracil-DNA glycosylase [Pantoea sp. Edef]PPI87341.1 uracil-DNA glycosylase [Candidatus Pantoea edessiphila]